METKFTVEYFIEKFERIPEHRWMVGTYSNVDGSKKCALGHCDATAESLESTALFRLFNHIRHREGGWSVGGINDGKHPYYKQPTPKQRILAALRDIQAMQASKAVQPEVKPERVVYVTIDSDVRDLQKKELTLN